MSRREEIFGEDSDKGKERAKGKQISFTLECLECGNKLGAGQGGFQLIMAYPVVIQVMNKQLSFQVPQFNPKLFIEKVDWAKGVKCMKCGSTNVKVSKFEKEL